MINAEIDDKNCKITLKGIDNKAKDMSTAMKIIAKDLQSSSFISAHKEPL
ncbi:hypothetical protein SAMN05720761_1096 [Fibrobacter sp. UWCM]|nr:hypothetical protein [Fibrobacter sp. UWCM]SHH11273.1 hypothetical protein SAMN05720761_1096 [Fibrobacter sp. UWCM]